MTADEHAADLLAFWEVARVRAGVMRTAAVTGPGVRGSLVPPTWSFDEDPEQADRQLGQVLAGTRTGTSTALAELTHAGAPLPVPGDLSIITDAAGRPAALVRTTRVATVPFDRVDEEFAAAEAEGDGTLAAWRTERERYWRRALAPLREAFTPDLPVVTERFALLYPRPSDRGRSERGPSDH